MQGWRLGFLGIESIPPWLGEFEVEQFFRLSPSEIATVKTRRGDQKQLGLALHVGFLRMSGRQLNSTDVIHWRILSFLGVQLNVSAPRVASLRALYPRRPTLHEHQRLAKALLGFRKMTEPVRRQLVGHLRQTRGSASEPAELLINARQWLYEHRYLICSERELLDICRAVLIDHKSKLVKEIGKLIPLKQRKRWVAELSKIRPELGDRTYLEWLRQSPRQRRGQGLVGAFERIHFLLDLKVGEIALPTMPIVLLKSYANRISRLKLTRFNRLRPDSKTVGLPCFLQMTLWSTTDEAIEAWIMRVSEVRRLALTRTTRAGAENWQARYDQLLSQIERLAGEGEDQSTLADKLTSLVLIERGVANQTRADQVRFKLMEMNSQVRTLLRLITALPIHVPDQDGWLKVIPPIKRGSRRWNFLVK